MYSENIKQLTPLRNICSFYPDTVPLNQLSGSCDVTTAQAPPPARLWLPKLQWSWCGNTVGGACSGLWQPTNRSRLMFLKQCYLHSVSSSSWKKSEWGGCIPPVLLECEPLIPSRVSHGNVLSIIMIILMMPLCRLLSSLSLSSASAFIELSLLLFVLYLPPSVPQE